MNRRHAPCSIVAFILTAVAIAMLLAPTAHAAYVSYHDLGAQAGEESTGNITTHQSASGSVGVAVDTSIKDLIKFSDGSDTGVDFSIAGANGMDPRNTGQTNPPAGGTDADALFNVTGLNLTSGTISEGGNDGSGATTFTFDGLNANQLYDIAFYGDRAASNDGVERFTLGGADSANNASSAGTVVSTFVSDWNTRPNATKGEVVRWTHINAGDDGVVTITMDPEVTTDSNIAYVSALRLEEMPIYRETFGNDSGSDQGLGYSDWIGYYGSSATLLPDTGSLRADVTSLDGPSTGSGPINSDLDNNETDNDVTATGFGRLLWPVGGGVSPALVYTEEFVVERDRLQVDSISWDQATNGGTDSFQVALEIGGDWFVSDEVFTGPNNSSSGTFDTNAMQMSLDFQAALWRSLAFTPGSTLGAPGSLVALPDGDITAFGLYGSFNATMWFDTYTIEATSIPTPAALPAGLAMFSLIAMRRRRRI